MRALYDFATDEFKSIFQEFGTTFRNQRTLYEYAGYVNLLCNHVGVDFLYITKEQAQSYIDYMAGLCRQGKLSKKTLCVRLSSYKKLSKYVGTVLDDYEDPFAHIIRPEIKDKIDPNHIPSIEELDQILSAAKDDPQLYLILALATRVGFTATNILSMQVSNVVEEEGKLFIRLDNKKPGADYRYVLLPEDVATLLRNYLEKCYIDEQGHFFFNAHHRPLRIRNLDSKVDGLIRTSGVKNRYTMKDLRSRAILEMVKAGAKPEMISEYTGLGHLRIQSFVSAKGLISNDCPADLVNYQLKTS